MYLSKITIENFRCFGSGQDKLELRLNKGLTALVGENDGGKTAVIDALRFVLGTTDQEWQRLEDEDYNADADPSEIRIACKFEELNEHDKRTFVEFLTYGENPGDEPVVYVNWTVENKGEIRRGRLYRRPEIRSGKNGNGPTIPPERREFLRATYLRPLRNAARALTAGRGSRLSEVLAKTKRIGAPDQVSTLPEDFDLSNVLSDKAISQLGVLDIGLITNKLLKQQQGIGDAKSRINKHLEELTIRGDEVKSEIGISEPSASVEVRLRMILEKLDLVLEGEGEPGLGSSNLLFMACELLLLSQEAVGNKLLLIEEPEAHLHPQRQLRVMRFLQDQAESLGIQVIVTTHSPNLASVIKLNNLVMIKKPHAYAMAEGETNLEKSDYRFLERYLDVTKANLFFARGVLIVEGPSEAILLPELARIFGRDLAEYGVSIVNVGGVGLRRFARIFPRKHEKGNLLDIPVACLTDMDVMPNCAPAILGKVKEGEGWPPMRRWQAKKDFPAEEDLEAEREKQRANASGQYVRTFVSDAWTLEYDLAFCGLAKEVYLAACLADRDDELNRGSVDQDDTVEAALAEFAALQEGLRETDECSLGEVLASSVYARFARDGISKPIAAQYLAEHLVQECNDGKLGSVELLKRLPQYLVQAIEYVTEPLEEPPSVSEAVE